MSQGLPWRKGSSLKVTTHRVQKYIIDEVTYDSLEDVPEDVREKHSDLFETLTRDADKNGVPDILEGQDSGVGQQKTEVLIETKTRGFSRTKETGVHDGHGKKIQRYDPLKADKIRVTLIVGTIFVVFLIYYQMMAS